MLRDKLGAELVESVDPMYADDPARAEHEVHVPGRVRRDPAAHRCRNTSGRRRATGELEFAVPGWDVTSRRLRRGAGAATRRRCRRSSTCGASAQRPRQPEQSVRDEQVPRASAATRASRTGPAGSPTRSSRTTSSAPAPRTRSAIRTARADPTAISYLKMQSVLRMVILKVMYENGIDVFVNPEQTTPPYKLGWRRRARGQRPAADQLLHGVHGAAAARRRWTCRPATPRSSTTRSTC